MLTLKGLKRAEQFVQKQVDVGNDVRWDGWDIVFFRESPKGQYSQQGAFRNGAWGFDNRAVVNADGVWEVDYRNVRRTRRVGN